ncbi:MAG: 60S ribosomal protein L22 [Candidatus Lokiarchaeota archaeon]|nr:60S ribosomal protein L22 [Candidatus Lokiarchaeota archaeon]
MSETKTITINIKASGTTSKWKDEYTNDLMRSISEMLPHVDVNRKGNELELTAPANFSNRTIKLRIKKFLHQKGLKDKFRPVSYRADDKIGYMVIEKKIIELSYY